MNESPIELSLPQQIERFSSRDWRVLLATTEALVQAGNEGLVWVFKGLSHPHPRVRRHCADFFDHYGDDRCISALLDTARHDPVPSVRRAAVHSLGCQRCKSCPLNFDLVGFLVERAQQDENLKVRHEAIYGLYWQPQDERVADALHALLQSETDEKFLKAVRYILKFHDPAFRQQMDERARDREYAKMNGEHRPM
jgi:HEAT repeat protein